MASAWAAAHGVADARTGANRSANAAAVANGMSMTRTADHEVAGFRAGAKRDGTARRRPENTRR